MGHIKRPSNFGHYATQFMQKKNEIIDELGRMLCYQWKTIKLVNFEISVTEPITDSNMRF